jgi:hypothetical protein
VALTVTVEVAAVAPEAAVSLMFCGVPGVSVSVDGLAVTPEGNPVREMATLPVKPF